MGRRLTIGLGALFAALAVTQAPAFATEPHWYLGSSSLTSPQLVMSSKGTLEFTSPLVGGDRVVKCRFGTLEMTVANPLNPALAGEGEVTELTLPKCTERVTGTVTKMCPTHPEKPYVKALGLAAWPTMLEGSATIKDRIEDVDLEVKCNGTSLATETYTGTLSPVLKRNRLLFSGSGPLENQISALVGIQGGVFPLSPTTSRAKNP